MLTTRHPVEFAYARQEIEALFRLANEEDVERRGHYDARSAAINVWSHHWQHPATRDKSDIIGTVYFHWAPTPVCYEIEVDEGFSLEDLLQELGRLEQKTLGVVKHGDVPREDPPDDRWRIPRHLSPLRAPAGATRYQAGRR